MDRRELLEKLRALKPWLEEQGVTDLRLFGSFARDEAKEDSDVDLLCRTTHPIGLEFFGIEADIADRVGRRVELVEDCELHPIVRRRAELDFIDV